jgi:hypothetical protein
MSTSQIESEQIEQANSNQSRKLKEYLNNSSIHSFNHIAAEKSRYQKLFWVLFFIISMAGFEFMSRTFYKKLMADSVSKFQSDESFSVDSVNIVEKCF